MTASSAPRAPRGARVLVFAQLAKAGAMFLGLVVLSRLLTPAEFGLVAVPLAIVGVGEILRDMGLSAAAITAKTLSRSVRSFLFWTNIGLGLLLALIVIVSGWIVTLISPGSELLPMLAVLALVFIVNGVGAQYRASLTRGMKFGHLALTDSVAGVGGVGLAILLAISGAGYWALIAQPLAIAVLTAGMSILFGRWLPSRPATYSEAKSVLGFGVSVAWSESLQYLGNNSDTFLLGAWGSSAQLGFYTRSFQLAIQPLGLLKQPLTSVALPILSRQADIADRFERNVFTGQRLLSYTVVPLAVFLSAAAYPVVLIVLGGQWTVAIPLVRILALAGALQQLVSVSYWIFMARNEGKSLRRFSAVSVTVKVVFIAIAVPFGAEAVALAYLLAASLMAPTVFVWACRVAKLRATHAIKDLIPALTLLTAAGLAGFLTCNVLMTVEPLLQLIGAGAAFVAVYALGATVPRFRRDFKSVVGLILGR